MEEEKIQNHSRLRMREELLEKMRRISILQLQQKVTKRIRQELFQEMVQIQQETLKS